jgi:hypothetical protein
MKKAIMVSLALIGYAVPAGSVSTVICKGQVFDAGKAGATGGIIGEGVSTATRGLPCLSLSHSAGTGPANLGVFVGSRSESGSWVDSTTVWLAPGGAYEKRLQDGLDSLGVVSIAAGDTLLWEVSN